MNVSEHLETQRIYDLLDGRLDPAAESAAQGHLLRCERCRSLERECAGVVDSLRWYASQENDPPAGYWDGFWAEWSPSRYTRPAVSLPARRQTLSRLAPALAMAAALALLIGLWWTQRPPSPGTADLQTAHAPPLRQTVAATGWGEDYTRFEQMSSAVGGIGPISKGIALASLAEQP